MCGVVGLGRLLAGGNAAVLADLRRLAADPRWRIREAVAIALQRFGDADFAALLGEMRRWARGTALERRAAVAALCEPRLLGKPDRVRDVLALLEDVTVALPRSGRSPQRRVPEPAEDARLRLERRHGRTSRTGKATLRASARRRRPGHSLGRPGESAQEAARAHGPTSGSMARSREHSVPRQEGASYERLGLGATSRRRCRVPSSRRIRR